MKKNYCIACLFSILLLMMASSAFAQDNGPKVRNANEDGEERIDEKGFKKLINIETSTKITSFTKDDGQVKSGFSKIKAGQRLYVAGFPDLKVKDQINADRIIFFPDLAISQGMKNYFDLENQNTSTPSAKPTQ